MHPHTWALPFLLSTYSILGNLNSAHAQVNSCLFPYSHDHHDLSFSDFPQEFKYLVQKLTLRHTLICVCCLLCSWHPLPGHLVLWHHTIDLMFTPLQLPLPYSTSSLLSLSYAIASTPSWNLFSAIPLHVSWFRPYPAVLAPLHVSYSHLRRENMCWGQLVISHANCSSPTNPHLDNPGPHIVLVLIPIRHGQDVRVMWCQDWWPVHKEPLRQGWGCGKHWAHLKDNIPKAMFTVPTPSASPQCTHHGRWKYIF